MLPRYAIPLSKLPIGSSGKIVDLELDGLLRRRVLDLGMVPGTQVECVRRSPSGDPTAYKVRGAMIALRSENAKLITVYLS
ncbi:MAG: ferrous iron transport protein A [Firmicutes bacterium]|nr:ferrous iron transport protein A [Bacillota bacterium]